MNQEIFSTADFYKATRFWDLKKYGPEDMHQFLSFTTKEQYLAWRAFWRTTNAALIKDIRAIKAVLHQPHHASTWRDMGVLSSYKQQATALRYLRMASRQRAGVQYRLAKEALQAASAPAK